MKQLIVLIGIALLFGSQAKSGPVMLTFDELPMQPANGLTFAGVTFGFTEDGVPSTDAQYDVPGPSPALYLSSPVLGGPLSPSVVMQLLMSFDTPVVTLDFAIALDTLDSETPGANLTLYDGQGNVLNTYDINTSVLIANGFSEALFSYGDPSILGSLSGPPVSQAALTFPLNVTADLFAIDNLTLVETPEPATWIYVPGGMAGIAALALLRRRAKRRPA